VISDRHAMPLPAVVLSPGSGEVLDHRDGDVSLMLTSGAATGGAVPVAERRLGPGAAGAPLHRHQRLRDSSCVLEGVLTLRVGDSTVPAPPGGFACSRGIVIKTPHERKADPVDEICPFCADEQSRPGGLHPDVPLALAWADSRWRLFADLTAESIGRCLLAPRRHVASVTGLEPGEASQLGPTLARLMAALQAETSAQAVYLYAFDHPHLHIHLAPHRPGDALSTQIVKGSEVTGQKADWRGRPAPNSRRCPGKRSCRPPAPSASGSRQNASNPSRHLAGAPVSPGEVRRACHSQADGLPYFRSTGTAAKVMISGHITLVLS
jgi:diadenosine tetraphosphate (Ap4A) HIT family hydrolase